MKILIRNLARTTTQQEIIDLFAVHGTVSECTLVIDQKTGKSKGFAFVEMPQQGEALAAILKLNGSRVAKEKIRVKKA